MLQCAIEEGGIALLCLAQPPENALNIAMARALADQITDLAAQPAIHGIILHAEGAVFATGPDLSPADLGDAHAALSHLGGVIEGANLPVVAVIDGLAHGAGLELALAANTRVAGPKARLAHSHLKLALLPLMGAAQRLTRLAGPAVALELLRVGQAIGAPEAARLGLIDVLVDDGDPLDKARAILRDPATNVELLRPASARHDKLQNPAAFQATIRHYRKMDLPATTARLVDCVEAVQLLPFETGLDYEATAFLESQSDDRSRALRHLLGAEARVALPGATVATETANIRRIATLGSANGVAGWSVAALNLGMSVVHVSGGDPAADSAVGDRVDRALAGAEGVTEVQLKARMVRYQQSAAPDTVANVDMVLITDPARVPDTVTEMSPGGIMALGVTGDAEPAWPVRKDVQAIGLRASGIVDDARLIELVTPAGAAPDFVAGMAQLMQRLGRVPIVTPADEGSVGTAVWGACVLAARALVRLGGDPAVIDAALQAQGFAVLPFGGTQVPLGRPMRQITPQEAVNRCYDAMANAGALLVQAGVAQRPSDVDLAMVHGFGLPRDLGGPMFAADAAGLLKVRNRMRARQGEDAEFWAPAPLFGELTKNGQRFDDLNRDG